MLRIRRGGIELFPGLTGTWKKGGILVGEGGYKF